MVRISKHKSIIKYCVCFVKAGTRFFFISFCYKHIVFLFLLDHHPLIINSPLVSRSGNVAIICVLSSFLLKIQLALGNGVLYEGINDKFGILKGSTR